MSLAQALAAIPLFSGLTDEQLEVVAQHLRRRSYGERDVIVRRDSPGDALFIMVTGKVKVAYLDDEDETIIAHLAAGDFFGELSILDGEGRSADVVAVEPTEVLVLSVTDFNGALMTMPAIAIALLRELAGRLRRSTSWIHALSSQDVYGRIARQLVSLSDTHGVTLPNGGGTRISLRLTQNDIAGIVGASRESVNKAMGYFKSKGFISVDTSYHVTVYDRAALDKRASQ